MSYKEKGWKLDDLLSDLRAGEKVAILSGRQAAVDAISSVLQLVDRDTEILKQCREGLIKAREVAKVANPDQLLQTLDAVKVIVTALRGRF